LHGLDNLLKTALGIGVGLDRREALGQGTVDGEHDACGLRDPTVEKHGTDQCLEHILERRDPVAGAKRFVAC
jgi:hypothetical protein